ncbi:MAG TPA: hypothetical protein VJ652_15215 [Noviherbaspirillum sp.]|nr:hypothetical protein [Noviherbaspirillum sp.]
MSQQKPRGAMTRTPSRIKLERLRTLLQSGETTRDEMADKLAISEDSVGRYLRFLRSGEETHIKRWQRREGAPPIAFYVYGKGKDAAKPRAFSEREQNKRCYAKMKRDDPAKYAAYLDRARLRAKERNRKLRGKPIVPADPAFSWIPRRELKEAA